MDARRLYIGQLLRNYKSAELFSPNCYTVNYRFAGDREDSYRIFNHNEGIDFAIEYIRELEKKIDELQYIENIIELAKRKDEDVTLDKRQSPLREYYQPRFDVDEKSGKIICNK